VRGSHLVLKVPVILMLAVLLVAPTGAIAAADRPKTLLGQVSAVVDGDTIQVRIGGRTERVRYIGINTPEMRHPVRGTEGGAREATEGNRKLVEGQLVRLELDVQERDRYGRLLAYVSVGEMMVNAEMVAQGYAQVMTIPPNVRHQELFLKLQREARLLQIGLWQGTGPLPPEPGVSSSAAGASAPAQAAEGRPSAPQDSWTCPLTHPIKGNFTTHSGERCIYHVPGGQFYSRTKPERCYATGEEAARDGCRRSRR
jgi:micrococcal nuclease